MKKVKLLTTIFLLAQLMLNAQIVLEHTFSVPQDQTFPIICKFDTYGEKWLIPSVGTDKFSLYNLDYSLFKEINIPAQQDHYYGVSFVSDKLFDLDGLIEYMITDFGQTKVKIYKEDGSLIFSEGDATYTANIRAPIGIGPIFNTVDGTKMGIGTTTIATGATNCRIFNLPGHLLTTSPELDYTNSEQCAAQVFPNPNDGQTNIAYKLPLGDTKGQIVFYSMQGEVIKSITVDRQSGCIKIDNANLPSGTYLYQVTTGNNSSEMKKMIIN